MSRVTLLALFIGVLLSLSASPTMSSTPEAQMLELINSERTTQLVMSPELSAQAEQWSQRMIDEQRVFHSVGPYVENVGIGGSVTSLHASFMQSPPHRAAILNEDYEVVGIGIVEMPEGAMAVTVRFVEPRALPSPSPTPEPSPSPSLSATPTPQPSTPPTERDVDYEYEEVCNGDD